MKLIFFVALIFIFLFFSPISTHAESCDPTTGDDINFILDGKACVFDGSVDGVDAGAEESEKNNASLTLKNNSVLTIPNNQTLSCGSLKIEPGSYVIRPKTQKGSDIHIGKPLYYSDIVDGDNDSIPASGGEVSLVKEGKKRKGKNKPYTGDYDCNDANKNIYHTLNVGTDADHDGYIVESAVLSTCVGDSKTINDRTYYDDLNKDSIKLADIVGINDCNDNDYDPTNTCE